MIFRYFVYLLVKHTAFQVPAALKLSANVGLEKLRNTLRNWVAVNQVILLLLLRKVLSFVLNLYC